jgi:hypothetical protein
MTQFVAVPESEVEDATLEMSDEEKAFMEFRNSFEAGDDMPSIRVSRIPDSGRSNPMTAKPAYCFSAPIDRYGFDELCEYIRDTFGSGIYRIISTKKGHRGTALNQLLEIVEAKRKTTDSEPDRQPNVGALLNSIMDNFSRMQERTEQMFARINAGQSAGAADPVKAMQASMDMFTKMLAAMAPMFGGRPAGGNSIEEIEKLLNVAERLNGGGGGRDESNFYSMATEGLRTLKTIAPVLARTQIPALPSATPRTTPTAQPVESAETPKKPEPSVSPIKKQVDMLVFFAESGEEPGETAERILMSTPDDKLKDLQAFVTAPDVLERMTEANPAVTNHLQFFSQLKEKLAEMIGEALAETNPPAT